MVSGILVLLLASSTSSDLTRDLNRARDRQDRSALEAIAAKAAEGAKQDDAAAQYRVAVAQSYVAEVAQELRDKNGARAAAEAGIKAAQRAVELKPDVAEHHRILGTLCGQVIPANVLAGMKYGRCALDEINKALELDPKSAKAYLSRGVGNYYLPPAFGGGTEPAIRDFRKAIEFDPRSSEAYLWLGLGLRKANQNAEARKAFQKALQLNPNRVWVKEQLEKTPAQ
ncbi:MAG: tetratricopeptide repeat protein [Bryobacteraceae bacterium]|nr:tetratricopeptide repeat protein [Bryobacteraceae bacterium]